MDFSQQLFLQVQTNGSREIVDKLARTPLSQIVTVVAVLTVVRVFLFLFLRKHAGHRNSLAISLAQLGNEFVDSLAFAAVLVFMLIRPFGVQAFLIPTGSMWPEIKVNDFVVANKAVYRFSDPKVNDVVVFHAPKEGAISPDDLDASGELKFDFVKRCIGVPGDLVEFKNGVLYRNGKRVEENYEAFTECMDDPSHCQQYRQLSGDEKRHVMPSSFKLINWHGEIIPLNYTQLDANAPIPMISSMNYTEGPYHVAPRYQLGTHEEQQMAKKLPAQRIPAGYYLMVGDNRNNSFDGRAWGLVARDRIVGRAELVWWPLSDIHLTH